MANEHHRSAGIVSSNVFLKEFIQAVCTDREVVVVARPKLRIGFVKSPHRAFGHFPALIAAENRGKIVWTGCFPGTGARATGFVLFYWHLLTAFLDCQGWQTRRS